jgi:hypothetical protein
MVGLYVTTVMRRKTDLVQVRAETQTGRLPSYQE